LARGDLAGLRVVRVPDLTGPGPAGRGVVPLRVMRDSSGVAPLVIDIARVGGPAAWSPSAIRPADPPHAALVPPPVPPPAPPPAPVGRRPPAPRPRPPCRAVGPAHPDSHPPAGPRRPRQIGRVPIRYGSAVPHGRVHVGRVCVPGAVDHRAVGDVGTEVARQI